MSYISIDELQKALAEGVFRNRQDTKKAAGRALGTIVELITFYVLREWGFGRALTIELALPEFGNPEITHNVEFGLHAVLNSSRIEVAEDLRPITSLKLLRLLRRAETGRKSNALVSGQNILRNACLLREEPHHFLVANLLASSAGTHQVEVIELRKHPFAMVECKRVGVEEGARKGPTTIEKAKQGAYVAKHVSALQKIRAFNGEMFAAMARPDNSIELRPWKEELDRLVYEATAEELAGFVLTVGVVSNHGNWFTSDDPNKELKVLKQSYDWLLFLNDHAIAEFINSTILSSDAEMVPVRAAFERSYTSGQSGNNVFTKVKIEMAAHIALCAYFQKHIERIQTKWFSVLSPGNEDISTLREELVLLERKDWSAVHSPGDEKIHIDEAAKDSH